MLLRVRNDTSGDWLTDAYACKVLVIVKVTGDIVSKAAVVNANKQLAEGKNLTAAHRYLHHKGVNLSDSRAVITQDTTGVDRRVYLVGRPLARFEKRHHRPQVQ